jgi:hypothetical protein
MILGLNPAFERDTIILSSNASEETVIHETLHVNLLGERIAYPLSKRILELRKRFPPFIRRKPVYEIQEIPSSELEVYGLKGYEWKNGYKPAELKVLQLRLKGYV